MKKNSILILLLTVILQANAQDNKKVDLYLMVGLAPTMYNASGDIYDSFALGPWSAGFQVFYNITKHIAAGIHTQAGYYQGTFSDTRIGNAGLTGKFTLNPNSLFSFYGGLIVGQTLVMENSYISEGAINEDDLTEILTYDESKFTAGLFAGLEIKIINSISFNLQASQLDVFGAFANDFVIHTISGSPQTSNGYIYIAPGTAEAYTYVPFYVNGGFIIKFGKKKL